MKAFLTRLTATLTGRNALLARLTAERAEALKEVAFYRNRPGLLVSDLTRNNNRADVAAVHAEYLTGRIDALTPAPALTGCDLRRAAVAASLNGAETRARNYLTRAAVAASEGERLTFLKLHREESAAAADLTEALARFN
jgi:hypothetical protein